jgi:HK97 gp10 family phage protein
MLGGGVMQLMGDVTLLKRLHDLPVKVQKKIGRRAIAKAARKLVKAAKARVPMRSGQLKKSIGYRPRTYKSNVVAIVGPRKGFATTVDGKRHDPAKIAHLVELGHGGPYAAEAKPFLRPAMDSTTQSNLQLIGAELASGIEQEAAK